MSDKTKDSLLVISDNFRLTVRDFFLTARLGGHRTVRTARARHGGVRQRRDRHFLPPTFRDEQLSSLGTSRFFLGTSVRPYGRTVSRPYVRKKRMSSKQKIHCLSVRTTFVCRYVRFFFRYVARLFWGGVRKRFFAVAETFSKKNAPKRKNAYMNPSIRTTFVCRYVRFFFRYVVTRLS